MSNGLALLVHHSTLVPPLVPNVVHDIDQAAGVKTEPTADQLNNNHVEVMLVRTEMVAQLIIDQYIFLPTVPGKKNWRLKVGCKM
jgi:hypothetical protein